MAVVTPATSAASEQAQQAPSAQPEAPASAAEGVEPKKLPLLQRIIRAAGSSVLATGASVGGSTALLLFSVHETVASAVGFAAGAAVNWVFARSFVWGRKGKPDFKGELVPYLAVIALTGLFSVGLTTVAGMVTDSLEVSGFLKIAIIEATFIGSYGLVFALKFTLLDRFVFAGGAPLEARTREAKFQS